MQKHFALIKGRSQNSGLGVQGEDRKDQISELRLASVVADDTKLCKKYFNRKRRSKKTLGVKLVKVITPLMETKKKWRCSMLLVFCFLSLY